MNSINVPWIYLLPWIMFALMLITNINLMVYTSPSSDEGIDLDGGVKGLFQKVFTKKSNKVKIIAVYVAITLVEFILVSGLWYFLKYGWFHKLFDFINKAINAALNALPLTALLSYVMVPLIILYAIYITLGIRAYRKKKASFETWKKEQAKKKEEKAKSTLPMSNITINDVNSFLLFKRNKDLAGAKFKDETWFQLSNEEQLARVKKAKPNLNIKVDRYPCILMINKNKAKVISPSQAIKIVKEGGKS
ncbi:hypothetical protein [Ligilactobacillus salivarius]|uniref:hypothetical protein n=1 Tax=Ligilactobacillus salivarius TaxID=1624 RepID=UPI0009D93717|nr:hypothetical protein [Ligilactobacillus salivarius]OQR18859.1 hypothetical protein B6U39_09655 [Ligilactobacillus salivarius]